MRRVVITGIGVVSSIGNDCAEVTDSLRSGRSGIANDPEYAELGFRSHVCGPINIDVESLIDRKIRRFMGAGAAYNYIAMKQAVEDSGLSEAQVSNIRSGLIMGSGGPSTSSLLQAWDTLRAKGLDRKSVV